MGYRLVYDMQNRTKPGKWNRRIRILMCLVFLAGAVGYVYPEVRYTIRKILFSGDPAVTAAALEEFTVDLRSGVDFGDSFRSFCLRILEGAGFASLG